MITLPAPTGPHPVGLAVRHLVDPARTDPWDGSTRELMASVYYPAHDVAGFPTAPYMTPGAAALFVRLDTVYLHPQLPSEGVDWTAIGTHAHVGAPPAAGPWPVLVYSPGGGDPRTLGTALAEDLASHGFVVVTVDHPGETSEVEFPGGRVRPVATDKDRRDDPEAFRTLVAVRIDDVRSVLDRLLAATGGWPPAPGSIIPPGTDNPGPADPAAHKPDADRPGTGDSALLPDGLEVDRGRVGTLGHSAGGATAANVLFEDKRVGAAADIEGYLDYLPTEPGGEGELFPVARHGVDRPLLFYGTDGFRDARFDRAWAAVSAHAGAERVESAQGQHWGLTDFSAIAPQLRHAGLMTAEQCDDLVGTRDQLTPLRWHVRDFFTRVL